ADTDNGAVNGAHIAVLCADDWGLWRTITANLERCRGHVTDYELPDEDRARIEQRFDLLLEKIEAEPKSRGWRRRAKVGDKKRWDELPEEVAERMRVFFATDIHGSEVCWKKFLNSGAHYKADVVVLGGDMTGKALVPVIDDGVGKWHSTLLDNREVLDGEDAVKEFEAAVIRR